MTAKTVKHTVIRTISYPKLPKDILIGWTLTTELDEHDQVIHQVFSEGDDKVELKVLPQFVDFHNTTFFREYSPRQALLTRIHNKMIECLGDTPGVIAAFNELQHELSAYTVTDNPLPKP